MADVKHEAPRLSIQTRLGHANRMANIVDRFAREQAAKGILRDAEAGELIRYTSDVIGTFKWLIDEEAGIRAWLKIPVTDRDIITVFVALPAEDRAAILAHLDVVVATARKAMEAGNA